MSESSESDPPTMKGSTMRVAFWVAWWIWHAFVPAGRKCDDVGVVGVVGSDVLLLLSSSVDDVQ